MGNTSSIPTFEESKTLFLKKQPQINNSDLNKWQAGQANDVLEEILSNTGCASWADLWNDQNALRAYIREHWKYIFDGKDNGHIVVRTTKLRDGSAAC